MMDFVMANMNEIGTLIVALALMIWAATSGKWIVFKFAAYRLMFSAERLAETTEGKERMEAVYAAIWQRLPKLLRRFVTEKTLREKLQDWYNFAKNSLGGNFDETNDSAS